MTLIWGLNEELLKFFSELCVLSFMHAPIFTDSLHKQSSSVFYREAET